MRSETRRFILREMARKPASYADIEALPPQFVGEIIGDELFVSPRPATPHARAGTSLGAQLVTPFDEGVNGPGGWVILIEPELHFKSEVLVPDLAAWRRERMPVLPHVVGIELAPDWVCEVLSPSTSRLDRTRKLPVYAREGVEHVWLIDALAKTLETYQRDGAEYRLTATLADPLVRAEPFDAVELRLGSLWAR